MESDAALDQAPLAMAVLLLRENPPMLSAAESACERAPQPLACERPLLIATPPTPMAVLLPEANPPLRPLPRMSARAYPPPAAIAVAFKRVFPRPLAVEIAVPPLEKLEAVTWALASTEARQTVARATTILRLRVIMTWVPFWQEFELFLARRCCLHPYLRRMSENPLTVFQVFFPSRFPIPLDIVSRLPRSPSPKRANLPAGSGFG